jgi:hypothetical protein
VCPTCEARAEWCRVIIDAYEWMRLGGQLAEVVPDPTPAVVDGILVLTREVRAAEAWETEAVRQDATARGR